MSTPTVTGNNPDKWNLLLASLDEKLQFGLLDHLRKVLSYHFEERTLYLEPSNAEEAEYLNRPLTRQQIQLFAQDIIGVEQVVIQHSSIDTK